MRVLITGARGRLGGKMAQVLSERGHEVTGIDRDELDIIDFAAVSRLVRQIEPALILHCAAWTDVDGCVRDPEQAVLVNGLGAQNVALAAAAVDAAVLYVSTNEVFDGRLNRPYREYDLTNPTNPYGYSKVYGERAVVSVNPRHYIVRIAWLFAHGGSNFLHAILRAAGEGKPLRVVTDEVANPTYNDDLAPALADLVESGRYGTYHLTNDGAVSRYGFARHTLDCAGYPDVPITPISRHEWPRPSSPPLYTPMANLAARSLGITLRPWQEAVEQFLKVEGLIVSNTSDDS
jgi:dTDP-4-dehydrorhamnose reductase